MKVEYKKKTVEDGFIPPDQYGKTFEELGITSGAKLVIIEMKRMGKYEMESEGQESEMEEMEDEMEEGDAEKGAEGLDEEGESKAQDPAITDVNEGEKAQLLGAPQEDVANPSSAPVAAGDL